MVADNSPLPPPTKGKPGPAKGSRQPHILRPAHEARARTLYLLNGLASQEIAAELGVEPKTIHALVTRKGWSGIRKAQLAASQEEAELKLRADSAQVHSGIATESEELAVSALGLVRESIDEKDAKSLSMASSGLRNLVDIARRIRVLDQQQAPTGTTNLNLFVLTAAPVREEKRVVAEPIQAEKPVVELPIQAAASLS